MQLYKDKQRNSFWYDDGIQLLHGTQVIHGYKDKVWESWEWTKVGPIVSRMFYQDLKRRRSLYRPSNKLEFLLITGMPFDPSNLSIGQGIEDYPSD